MTKNPDKTKSHCCVTVPHLQVCYDSPVINYLVVYLLQGFTTSAILCQWLV